MARLNPRLAAGVGVVTAFLLLGGPAAAAIAYPGGEHSDRGHSSDRGKTVTATIAAVATADRHGSDHGDGRSDGNGRGYDRGDGNDRGYDRGDGNDWGYDREGWQQRR